MLHHDALGEFRHTLCSGAPLMLLAVWQCFSHSLLLADENMDGWHRLATYFVRPPVVRHDDVLPFDKHLQFQLQMCPDPSHLSEERSAIQRLLRHLH